jgi:hypothetical protein
LKAEKIETKKLSPGTDFEKSATNQISFIDDVIKVPELITE